MGTKRLSKKEIEKILPPLEREKAIEQSMRYENEYKASKKELERIFLELERYKKQLEETQEKDVQKITMTS